MTADLDLDRIALAWLEQAPDELPDRVIDAVLLAAQTTPQVRRPFVRGPWRSTRMNRFAVLGTAVVLGAAVLGGALLLGGGSRGDATPTPVSVPSVPATATTGPSPSTDAAASAAAEGPIPASLHYRWIGPERQLPTLGVSSRTALNFTADRFSLSGTTYGLSGIMDSAATTDGATLHLVNERAAGGCAPGDAGTYDWSLSPGGSELTIKPGQDACADRAAAMPGTWYRTACLNTEDGCWGDLEAGTYPSQYIDPTLDIGATWNPKFGELTYTVPDGWANSSDWPNTFSLTPSANYATEDVHGPRGGKAHQIYLFTQPLPVIQDANCLGAPDAAADRSVAGLLAYLRSLKGVAVSAGTPVTVDGHTGTTVDLSIAPGYTTKCPDTSLPAVPLFSQAGDRQNDYGFGISGRERVRLSLVDLGGGDVLGIAIDSEDPTTFDELLTSAQPIIDSFRFQ